MILRVFLLLISFPALAADFHVVFDLDWTLVYPLEAAPNPTDPLAVEAGGKWYRYSDGAGEALERLHNRGVKISFFSGGDKERNLALLKKLKLPSGKTAESIAYKILSVEDMTRVSDDETLKFAQRFKKDLRKITSDLDRVVLIDDIKEFALTGQEKNMLWTGDTYNFARSYEEAQLRARTHPEYEAPNLAAWVRERAKIPTLSRRMERALEQSDAIAELHRVPRPSGVCDAAFLHLLTH